MPGTLDDKVARVTGGASSGQHLCRFPSASPQKWQKESIRTSHGHA